MHVGLTDHGSLRIVKCQGIFRQQCRAVQCRAACTAPYWFYTVSESCFGCCCNNNDNSLTVATSIVAILLRWLVPLLCKIHSHHSMHGNTEQGRVLTITIAIGLVLLGHTAVECLVILSSTEWWKRDQWEPTDPLSCCCPCPLIIVAAMDCAACRHHWQVQLTEK